MSAATTDRELLKLAAKANGGLLYVEDVDSWIHVDADGNRGAWWNPRDDDGDSRRLEVNLYIDVSFKGDSVHAYARFADCKTFSEQYGDDSGAATRLAVLRAAASIGEQS